MIVRGYRVGPLLRTVAARSIAHRLDAFAASAAFFFFFSLFPLLLFLTALVGLFGDRERTFDFLMFYLASVADSPDSFAPIRDALRDVLFSADAPALASTGALLAAWSGSNLIGELHDTLNTAYEVTQRRAWWKRQLLHLGIFLASAAIVAAATLTLLGGEAFVTWLTAFVGLDPVARHVWLVIHSPVAVLFLMLHAWTLYWFLPNVAQRKVHALVAAIAATVLWLLATLLFRTVVQGFASFDRNYGAIGGIIALLAWMYISMLVVLVCGELGSALHHGVGRVGGGREARDPSPS